MHTAKVAGRRRAIPLFGGLPRKSFSRIAAAATLQQYEAGATLFSEGDRVEDTYIVMQGAVELFSQGEGRYFTASVVCPIRPIALCANLSAQNPLSARTLEQTELFALPKSLISELFQTNPGFAKAVILELAEQCSEIVEHAKRQRLSTSAERVARWMLHEDRRNGHTGHVDIPFEKQVLASYLGMTPEHLSRNFSAMESAGVISVRGRSINLKDPNALKQAAGFRKDK